jgi:RNA polymerase sigma-70 factor (ECF subfamily)
MPSRAYAGVVPTDDELIDRVQAGDGGAFAELVVRYHTRLVRLAGSFVARRDLAEDIAQETWIAVLRGVDRFEHRSSPRTWLFAICVNQARSTGKREQRMVPVDASLPTVDPDRFGRDGAWALPPAPWTDAVDDRLQAAALAPMAQRAIDDLPDPQRQVVTLRDAEGLSSHEVCEVLSISEANQRVLLHRGRARVRSYLEREMKGGDHAALES